MPVVIPDLHEGDVGSVVTFTFKSRQTGQAIDLTGYTVVVLALKPDATTAEWTGLVLSDPAAGQAQYTTQAGDLDQDGYWVLQGEATKGSEFHPSDPVRIYVGPRYR